MAECSVNHTAESMPRGGLQAYACPAVQGLTDPEAVQTARKLAVDSLARLEGFSGLKKASTDWNVSLEGAM